jgi:hypothetical protein
MNIISWAREIYYRQVYNVIRVNVPFDYKLLNNYTIAEVKIVKDDIKIVLIKKAVLE